MRGHKFFRRIFPLAGVAIVGVTLVSFNALWRTARLWVYKDVIDLYSRQSGFDPIFVMAVVRAESGFVVRARSHRGAVGLMQLMPDTARETAQRLGLDPRGIDLSGADTNVRLGVAYLARLRQEFGEDRVSLLAAYNAGPAMARRWRRGDVLTADAILYSETRAFVERVVATERWLRRLQKLKRRMYG